MQGHGEKLTRKQEQAIAALLAAPSVGEAAQQTGVSEPTLYRWLKHDAFQTAYRAARREVVRQAVAHLQRASGEAVHTLQAIMGNAEAPASARVSAARTVLDTAIKAVELEDLEARIAMLEQQRQHT